MTCGKSHGYLQNEAARLRAERDQAEQSCAALRAGKEHALAEVERLQKERGAYVRHWQTEVERLLTKRTQERNALILERNQVEADRDIFRRLHHEMLDISIAKDMRIDNLSRLYNEAQDEASKCAEDRVRLTTKLNELQYRDCPNRCSHYHQDRT
jgi:uncharacterized protein YydD (DUF2326 family)